MTRTPVRRWLTGALLSALPCATLASCSETSSPLQQATVSEAPHARTPSQPSRGASDVEPNAARDDQTSTAGKPADESPDNERLADGGRASMPPGDLAGAGSGADSSPSAGAGGGGTEVDEQVACADMPEGTYCGSNLDPRGKKNVRYFCAAGALLAKAQCPSECNKRTNACVAGPGSGSGVGDGGRGCKECYAALCPEEFAKCDAFCRAHLDCFDSCDGTSPCRRECNERFEAEPQVAIIQSCVPKLECLEYCAENGN